MAIGPPAEGWPARAIRVEVLGPLRLQVDGALVEVPGEKRRAVLALLALADGRTATVEQLLDALWPAGVPESGRQALHSHVSRLRRQLATAADRLQTRPDGYRLELAEGELDLAQARALLASGRADAAADPAAAARTLRQAYALWRGPVLSDLTGILPVAAAVERCAQLRREVTDALIACEVAAGQAESAVGLATDAVAADPLREPQVLLLMRALAAAGRAPEALRVGRELRHRLAEETGLDPSTGLGRLEREIAAGAAGPVPASPVRPTRQATRLVGREAQVAALHRLLASERLVTLVGPGGVGKTRVALEVARHSQDAPVLLLAPVADPAAVPHALAGALDLPVVQGDVLSACLAVLAERTGLLVIDNCEHLLESVRDTVSAVMSACPQLSLLTTSREPLGLPAEHTFRLGPLPVPGPEQDLAQVPSVAVFLDRAGRVRPVSQTRADLSMVADIVRRLDGMPLAIQLAAGRLSTFALADLSERLDRALDLLGDGRPSGDLRHTTLRATIDWSYRLLTDDERRLFRNLAVFVDGVDLATAERVAADLDLRTDPGSVLARLVDASMIDAEFRSDSGVGTRYRMLHTLRAFGLDRLAAAREEKSAEERMLRWAVELTTWIGATLRTDREASADATLRRELPNLRAAWRLARSRGLLDEAAAMVIGLWDAVAYRDLLEIREWAEELAGDPALATHSSAAAVFGIAGEAVYHQGDYPRAARLARAGLERLGADPAAARYCLLSLSVSDLARGAYREAIEHSLAAAASNPQPCESLGVGALAAAYAGDLDQARRLHQQDQDPPSPSMRAWVAYVAGEIDNCAGHLALAEQHYLRAIDLAHGCGAKFLAGVAIVGLVSVQANAGRVREALTGYRQVIDYFARTGDWTHQWVALRNLAELLHRLGDAEPATILRAAADQAPDAPADPGAGTAPAVPVLGKTALLELARAVIQRHTADVERGIGAGAATSRRP